MGVQKKVLLYSHCIRVSFNKKNVWGHPATGNGKHELMTSIVIKADDSDEYGSSNIQKYTAKNEQLVPS